MVMGPPSPVRNSRSRGVEREQTVDGLPAKSDENNDGLGSGRTRPRVKLIKHKEAQLEFLDFYDKKSYGDMMLRSKSAACIYS